MATVNELTPLPPPPPQPFFPGFPPLDQLPHDDVGSQLNFTIWLLVGLAAAFLALRIYCKFLRRRGLWWDDYMLIAAWVSLWRRVGAAEAAGGRETSLTVS